METPEELHEEYCKNLEEYKMKFREFIQTVIIFRRSGIGYVSCLRLLSSLDESSAKLKKIQQLVDLPF